MAEALIVDADSHVEECEEYWRFLDPRYEARRPFPIVGENRPEFAGMNAFWYVDGQTYPRPTGRGVTIYATPLQQERAQRKPFSLGSQALTAPTERLRDLDAGGINVQVNYPTLFLDTLTEDVAFEAALMASYNQFLAQACAQAPERLKWAAVVPLRDPKLAVAEARRAHKLGATCVATTAGTLGDRGLDQAGLDPLWAELERMGMPFCVHCGWCNDGVRKPFDTSYGAHVLGFTVPVLMAFYAFLGGGILDRYPSLKLGFLEAGCEWVPYLVQRMDHYYGSESRSGRKVPEHRASEYLRHCAIYFTTEAEERYLPQVLDFVGQDRIMISADMPHGEAREGSIEEIRERTDLTEAQKRQILGEAAAAFYNIG
ncbi:MAG TPA: amidohydrolase family protein [Chloroflexota bacterium]|jgi:predicted TIM-barrel fold metal-dependent hydrolase